MKLHTRLFNAIRNIINRRHDLVVVPHKGKYSFEDTLVMRIGELDSITTDAAELLTGYAELMGYGEEYQKVCQVLERLKTYHERSERCLNTGCDWEESLPTIKQNKPEEKPQIGTGVFGLTWKQIEAKQGGKIVK